MVDLNLKKEWQRIFRIALTLFMASVSIFSFVWGFDSTHAALADNGNLYNRWGWRAGYPHMRRHRKRHARQFPTHFTPRPVKVILY